MAGVRGPSRRSQSVPPPLRGHNAWPQVDTPLRGPNDGTHLWPQLGPTWPLCQLVPPPRPPQPPSMAPRGHQCVVPTAGHICSSNCSPNSGPKLWPQLWPQMMPEKVGRSAFAGAMGERLPQIPSVKIWAQNLGGIWGRIWGDDLGGHLRGHLGGHLGGNLGRRFGRKFGRKI